MNIKKTSKDTPLIQIGQIIALKHLGYSDKKVSELITQWGYRISKTNANNMWKRYRNGDVLNKRANCGRKLAIDKDTKTKMLNEVLKNRFTTAADLYRNQNLNHNHVSESTI
jgi:hypothetical protein